MAREAAEMARQAVATATEEVGTAREATVLEAVEKEGAVVSTGEDAVGLVAAVGYVEVATVWVEEARARVEAARANPEVVTEEAEAVRAMAVVRVRVAAEGVETTAAPLAVAAKVEAAPEERAK